MSFTMEEMRIKKTEIDKKRENAALELGAIIEQGLEGHGTRPDVPLDEIEICFKGIDFIVKVEFLDEM